MSAQPCGTQPVQRTAQSSVPELPDITVYIEALSERVIAQRLTRVEVLSPFVLRTALPAMTQLEGSSVTEIRRLGKRIALGFDNDLWLVMHLMIAGRLAWASRAKTGRGRNILARLHFDTGVLTFTEAGTKKRASLHVLAGAAGLESLNTHGLETLACEIKEFRARLTQRNHTLKRALTDPRLFSGIGNAYSDEILHAAQLSPIQHTQKLSEVQIGTLFAATLGTLNKWTGVLREARGGKFPAKVTAFRDGMAVHGRYGLPCPRCETAIQRIRYVSNELNYCPRCQTGGRILADRALSRLLHKDWPRTIEELEGGLSSSEDLSG